MHAEWPPHTYPVSFEREWAIAFNSGGCTRRWALDEATRRVLSPADKVFLRDRLLFPNPGEYIPIPVNDIRAEFARIVSGDAR